jgi:hypothetical protein
MPAEEEGKVTLADVGVPEKPKETRVIIGRMGSPSQTVNLTGKATVGDALKAAGINLGTTEKVWVKGEAATLRTPIGETGTVISIISPKEAGTN